MSHWIDQAVFYAIYPLGFCDALRRNDFSAAPVPRLEKITSWLDHIQSLGANALYLGPVFESSWHGYDTADYYHVDRRLGTDSTLAGLSANLHQRGMHLVLDGVFNHVGRDFWAFRDLLIFKEGSAYRDWFCKLDFNRQSPHQDPFWYEGWNGNYDLVKLNLANPAVRDHLFHAVESWIRDSDIDGLRLDAADCLDLGFMRDLAAFCRGLKPEFWLMGEVIHGDYRRWANPDTLDSVTNYEVYKSLYSSFVDRNFYEISYALNRQFGPQGIYTDGLFYTFADNHDVNRVASNLINPAHLYPLYCLLLTIPGVPSIYYGSEWGLQGKKEGGNDRPLRPTLDLAEMVRRAPQPDLPQTIARLANIRRNCPALQKGNYQELLLSHEQLVFKRELVGERVAGALVAGDPIIVAVNAASQPVKVSFKVPIEDGRHMVDLLNPSDSFLVQAGSVTVDLHSCWARILC